MKPLGFEMSRFGGPEVLRPARSLDPVAGPGELVVAVIASDVMFLDTMIRAGVAPVSSRSGHRMSRGRVAGAVTSVGDVAKTLLTRELS